ncbi:hypothetical protein CcaCcLH18_06401 [Colletotrichum camelliae]|nr:hypothetical protein CcaCcLH18_06401 [Colletotrichum camelliae]
MFSFRPLEEADAIRLLVLHPSANTTAPLSGSLIHTTLSKCDADFHNGYLALSYVWGDPAPKESIRLDGISLGIAASVAEALTQLRNSCPGGTQRIWVDALCINQWDIAEKNRQVPLMGNIYSTASTTVIYLGSLSAKIETIFKAVRENKPKFVTVDAEGKSHVAHPNLVKCFNTNSGDKPSAVAIEELLQLPWFTRVWVLQELMLSRDAWVQCGALRVRWRELCALLVPILDRTKGPRCTALQNMQLLHRDGKSSSLSTILQMREGCRASDPRDMIFGYMGMHTDKEDVAKFITVDYETPLRRLLISTARYIYHCDGLEVLLFCVKRPHTNNWLNLPSWVPDWGIYEWWHATSLGREITGNIPATIRTHEFVLSDVQNITGSGPHRNPKFIRHVSPILPRPQDVPQYVVDFLNKAAEILRWPFNEVAKQKFLEEENVSFWRYVDIGSTNPQNPNSIGLFPDSFWDPAAEVERRSGNGVDDKISCKSLPMWKLETYA